METDKVKILDDTPPPFLKKWRNIYLLILIDLGLMTFLLYLFSRAFE
ncbi:MAG TPA: hypothetical protein PKA80_09995 [Ignavibacteriaceae bacterium]|nr:hypothetical protein [Ignavibacteriaceae bacterium]